jgi:hypothetical protein
MSENLGYAWSLLPERQAPRPARQISECTVSPHVTLASYSKDCTALLVDAALSGPGTLHWAKVDISRISQMPIPSNVFNIWPPTSPYMDGQGEDEAFLPSSAKEGSPRVDAEEQTNRRISCRPLLPWMILTGVLTTWLIIIAISTVKPVGQMPFSAREDGLLSTDLRDSQRAILYERKRYTGDLVYDSVSRRVLRMHDSEVQYVGEPSPQIDQAWDDLVRFEFPFLYGDEIPAGFEEGNRYSDQHFHFEPDFFHNLHCLNMLRMEISRALYPNAAYGRVTEEDRNATMELFGPGWRVNHLEHCIDRIRQALMCHGDLTPSYMYRYEGLKIPLFHTPERLCRKWEPIREWVNQRKMRDDSVGVNEANDMD